MCRTDKVPHHGFVELQVLESQINTGGSFPLGLLRCQSSPGGFKSNDEESSYVSAARLWRSTVRNLNPSTSYTFSCSISAGGSFSSPSQPTAAVQPAIETPDAPLILFLEWTSSSSVPMVRVRTPAPHLEMIWCLTEVGDGNSFTQMEGYAIVPGGIKRVQKHCLTLV